MRNKLNKHNLADTFFEKCRALENDPKSAELDPKYNTIILGALVMRPGAKIREKDLEYLWDLVPDVHCSSQYAWLITDGGFRLPGKKQFLAALDHYQEGVPRSFTDPR